MRLATVNTPEGLRAAVRCGLKPGPAWVDLAHASRLLGLTPLDTSLRRILQQEGPDLATPRAVVEALDGKARPDELPAWTTDGSRFAPTIPDPEVLIDFFAFEEHVRKARANRGLEVPPQWYEQPVYYRQNQRSLLGDGADVPFPPDEPKMDYELELAAVLGRSLESPTPDEAEKAIAGYCLFNDWSARGIQVQVMKVGLGPAKGKDFASSLGPWMVTPDELGPLDQVTMKARVNGETWSENSPGTMNWSWGQLLAFAGEGVRFEPGDVFGSGTLGGGCGLELQRFLAVGDRVELDGGPALGILTGTVGRRSS